jgi:hypothetical protein
VPILACVLLVVLGVEAAPLAPSNRVDASSPESRASESVELRRTAFAAEDETPPASPRPVVAVVPSRTGEGPLGPSGRSPTQRPGEPQRARATSAGVVLELRSEFGFERLLRVEFSNDRRISMNANDGLAVSAGLSFLPLVGGRLGTRASIGFKVDRLRADNGSALFTAFPLDVMEALYLGPLRLGAGLSVLLAPRLGGDGILDTARVAFDPAPGVVADVEWLVAPRARTGIGLRGSWYRFAANGEVQAAPAVGLVIRADLDVTGR